MKEKGIGMELNTKCMKSRCMEIFPHPIILKWALQAGIANYTFGSDAHQATIVGRHLKEASEIAEIAGIKQQSVYIKRQPILSPL